MLANAKQFVPPTNKMHGAKINLRMVEGMHRMVRKTEIGKYSI